MKITRVEPIFVDSWLIVKVETDEGINGYGEATLWGYLEPVETTIRKIASYLVGNDPMRLEQHSQMPFRSIHFSGGVLSSARAAVDIALWDILGKRANMPVYQLLGGKYREKCRTFQLVGGRTPEEAAERASAAVKEGFTVLRIYPFPGGPTIVQSSMVAQGVDMVRAVREAVGDRIDLGVEVHRAFTPLQAVNFAQAVEKYRLLFIEDPVPHEELGPLLYVARNTRVPIAAGERYYDVLSFTKLVESGVVGLIRPDLGVAGGISETRKIASIAEVHQVQLMPHLMASPMGTAAFLHLDAAIPNYAFQEYQLESRGVRYEIAKPPLKAEPGYAYVPEGPGLGVELNEEAIAKYPPRRVELRGRYHEDGSLVEF